MAKLLTDIHTHSKFSFDGQSELAEILKKAHEMGLAFYGVSEHFECAAYFSTDNTERKRTDADAYFHAARHLQEDYAGCMNVLVGAEFGYQDDPSTQAEFLSIIEKYSPDFVVNSVHGMKSKDYYYRELYGDTIQRSKSETYGEYLSLVRRSLDAPYPYDIVAHIGYVARYVPFEDRSLSLEEFGEEIDDILKTIINKDKILELNSSNAGGVEPFLPSREILTRYFQLGGRKISFGSDTHSTARIADKRAELMEMLKEIGFTYITVPCRGEHIKVEI